MMQSKGGKSWPPSSGETGEANMTQFTTPLLGDARLLDYYLFLHYCCHGQAIEKLWGCFLGGYSPFLDNRGVESSQGRRLRG